MVMHPGRCFIHNLITFIIEEKYTPVCWASSALETFGVIPITFAGPGFYAMRFEVLLTECKDCSLLGCDTAVNSTGLLVPVIQTTWRPHPYRSVIWIYASPQNLISFMLYIYITTYSTNIYLQHVKSYTSAPFSSRSFSWTSQDFYGQILTL